MAVEQVGLQAVFLTGEFQRGMRIYQQNINVVNNITQQMARQSEKSSKETAAAWEKGFTTIAKKAAVAVASFMAVQKAAAFMKESTLLAARVEMLGIAMESVGNLAGQSAEQMHEYEEAIKEKGITTQAARQALLQMAQAEIDFAKGADLARVAQDAGRIANINSSEAFSELIYAIQTGNQRLRAARMIGVQFGKAYEKMAVTLGKTTDELDEQEMMQARVNEVLEKGARITGTYEAALGTAGGTLMSLARHVEEITLSIGKIGLGAFSVGIQEATRLLEEFQTWIEENEEQLEDLGESFTALVGAIIDFADLELPVEDLTAFVETTSVLVDLLALGIEQVTTWKESLDATATVLKTITPEVGYLTDAIWVLQRALIPTTRLHDDILPALVEMKKADEDLFKTQQQLVKERLDQIKKEAQEEKAARARQIAAAEKTAAAEEEAAAKRKEAQEKIAETMTGVLTRIEDAQRDHDRKLGDMADDHRYKQERAWQKYGQDVAKEIAKGQKELAQISLDYERDVAEAIEDYNEQRLADEESLNKNLLRAQQDYERKAAQDRERYELNQVQGERRYQYERSRLIAEGDTLALEQLDAQHELEQQEAAENEALRVRQAEETQAALVEALEAAGREQAKALAEALADQLREMEEQSQEEIAEQEQANKDRLDEMASTYAEQQRMADEDYQRSIDKANQNYDRQQEDLGRNLARQEDLQELSGDQVANILEQYYGPDGVNREIMQGYYEWMEERAVVSAATVATAMAMSAAPSRTTPEFHPVYGMQAGGVLQGPAMAYVEPGVTEAFVPLSGPGAGGAFTHEFLNALQVAGLERGSPGDVSAIAREMARSLTAKIRSRRRG